MNKKKALEIIAKYNVKIIRKDFKITIDFEMMKNLLVHSYQLYLNENNKELYNAILKFIRASRSRKIKKLFDDSILTYFANNFKEGYIEETEKIIRLTKTYKFSVIHEDIVRSLVTKAITKQNENFKDIEWVFNNIINETKRNFIQQLEIFVMHLYKDRDLQKNFVEFKLRNKLYMKEIKKNYYDKDNINTWVKKVEIQNECEMQK